MIENTKKDDFEIFLNKNKVDQPVCLKVNSVVEVKSDKFNFNYSFKLLQPTVPTNTPKGKRKMDYPTSPGILDYPTPSGINSTNKISPTSNRILKKPKDGENMVDENENKDFSNNVNQELVSNEMVDSPSKSNVTQSSSPTNVNNTNVQKVLDYSKFLNENVSPATKNEVKENQLEGGKNLS